MSAEQITRYHALLKVCDLACAQAEATHTADRPEFWDAIATALQDDCPEQSAAAQRTASTYRAAAHVRQHFFTLLHS